jgi:hypothetical protein
VWRFCGPAQQSHRNTAPAHSRRQALDNIPPAHGCRCTSKQQNLLFYQSHLASHSTAMPHQQRCHNECCNVHEIAAAALLQQRCYSSGCGSTCYNDIKTSSNTPIHNALAHVLGTWRGSDRPADKQTKPCTQATALEANTAKPCTQTRVCPKAQCHVTITQPPYMQQNKKAQANTKSNLHLNKCSSCNMQQTCRVHV